MSKNNENRKITKEKLATANSVDSKLLDLCSTLSEAVFSITCTAALLSLASQALPSNSGGIFLCQYSPSAGKKTVYQQGISLLFQLLHRFFKSVDKITGEGDLRTCSTYKRRTVGGIRRFIWSLKISQEGHWGCNPHFDYSISSNFNHQFLWKGDMLLPLGDVILPLGWTDD